MHHRSMMTHIKQVDHVELEALYDQFKSLCVPGSNGGISWPVFEHCLGPLGLERNLITKR